MSTSTLVSIVTYNSDPITLRAAIEAVLSTATFINAQESSSRRATLLIIDNASSTTVIAETLKDLFGSSSQLRFIQNKINVGFAAAHNMAVKILIEEQYDYLLILNPDVRLEFSTIATLEDAVKIDQTAWAASPLLLRCDERLNPLTPEVIDAAGMELTSTLRHLDRGSETHFTGQYTQPEVVFGGTGACLLVKREGIERILLKGKLYDQDKCRIYPQLADDEESRCPLFDEAFFAYREDAELAWRANRLGARCLFVPNARAFHQRKVTPERRSTISSDINSSSVRNRFLMQIVNYSTSYNGVGALFGGILFWNIVVLIGVVLWERGSIKGLKEVGKLLRRSIERRALLAVRISSSKFGRKKWNS